MCCDIHPASLFQSGCSSPTPCSSCPSSQQSVFISILNHISKPNTCFFSYFLMHAHDYSAARQSRIEIKTFCEQVDSLNRASVNNIRTETNQRDGCRNPFCTSSFNPNRKYYLDHAQITVQFSPTIRISLPCSSDTLHCTAFALPWTALVAFFCLENIYRHQATS